MILYQKIFKESPSQAVQFFYNDDSLTKLKEMIGDDWDNTVLICGESEYLRNDVAWARIDGQNVEEGDWIVKDSNLNGIYHVWKPGHFLEIYEPVV
jgi:hypothetical protein